MERVTEEGEIRKRKGKGGEREGRVVNRDFDFGRGERGREEGEEELRTMAAELKIPPRLSTLSMAYRRHCDVCGSEMLSQSS